jgi:hypothetical protein
VRLCKVPDAFNSRIREQSLHTVGERVILVEMSTQPKWRQTIRKAICIYCGAEGGHPDHVPPKNLFMGPRTDLIRVPACRDCNRRWSELDERFRLLAALRATDTARQLFESSARGLQKRPEWRREIQRNSFWRPWSNDYQIRLPQGAFEPMIERITRALYWYEYGQTLDAAFPIKTYYLNDLQGMRDLLPTFVRKQVGGGQFQYAFQRYEPRPTCSTWIFVFHRRLIAGATTDDAWQREMREKMKQRESE